ncbi:MAG: 2-oxoacid:ferredoxin oxidoreductase subunit gamma [Syntrophus sp. (in: bacteria)]|nr:2-oxoacid:ferredoxin oxidoreductase subunit gamma [Syntrophus sp. (in: bacteria)]
MINKTIFAGFGGQGVLMMGYSYAHAAMHQNFHVTYLPSYGAEVRGGTANCTVAVADDEIASPIASEPDFLVVMNTPSLFTFQNRIAPNGAFFLNSSIIEARPSRTDVHVYEIPAGEIAAGLGNPRVQNIVMMGAYIRKTGLVQTETYLKSLREIIGEKKKSLMEMNRNAFLAGYDVAGGKD